MPDLTGIGYSSRDQAKRETNGTPDHGVMSPKSSLPIETQQTDFAVGDVNSKKRGSGARANSGKVSMALVPLHLLAGVARVFMGGKMKYAPWNWAKGMPYSTCFDCTMRHMIKWWYTGEELDAESGEHHIDHAICNLLMLKHYMSSFTEGDDRPSQEITCFRDSLDDFNKPFNEEDYLDRNPAIRERLDHDRQEGIQRH